MNKAALVLVLLTVSFLSLYAEVAIEAKQRPLMTEVDLNLNEEAVVELCNGEKVTVKLLKVQETRDKKINAVRDVVVDVKVNDETITLHSSMYYLPQKVSGVLIDCPVTLGFTESMSTPNYWRIEKDARLRLWPGDSSLTKEGTFIYPIKQRWFAGQTQMANEPVHAKGEDLKKKIYYHSGFDTGGSEGLDEVVCATDGLVVTVREEGLKGYEDAVSPRASAVQILDSRGWFLYYSHMAEISDKIVPGAKVKMGQHLGYVGQEGYSGGWTHLHFQAKDLKSHGKWGLIDVYALCREAYMREYNPVILACARPHKLAMVNEPVEIDGAKSWSKSDIVSYEWEFYDGAKARGVKQARVYPKQGIYSEILKVTDSQGNVDYDFAEVDVYDNDKAIKKYPGISANYHPSLNNSVDDKITFKAKTFNTKLRSAEWDFGDGSPRVTTDGDDYETTYHAYDHKGMYIVKVQCVDEIGQVAMQHLKVVVD